MPVITEFNGRAMAKVYRKDNTYTASFGSYFDGHVKIPGNFMVQPRTHFWGELVVEGRLDLGPQSVVEQLAHALVIVGQHNRCVLTFVRHRLYDWPARRCAHTLLGEVRKGLWPLHTFPM